MPEILHITTPESWKNAVADGEYRADSLATAGFIHFSTARQLPLVAERFFKGQNGLVVLRIVTEKLKPLLKWEIPSDSEERFPHLYGPLNLDAVVDVVALENVLADHEGY